MKVYILTETYECEDGIREMQILHVFKHEHSAQEKMQEKIANDEYGMIEKNGILFEERTSFSTNFNEGFLEYSIEEKNAI